MTLEQFEHLARQAWTEIPQEYKAGIEGLVVDAKARTHPEHHEFFTLGECVTEAYPSDFDSPDTVQSVVVLYYGSFRAVARDDESFDWAHEIRETLLHELQHHLEHLAADDALEDFDYAVEENFKRVEGQPFDPLFYRAGEPIADGWYRVEGDVFAEVTVRHDQPLTHEFDWQGERFRIQLPASTADVQYAVIEEEMPAVRGDLCVVRIRPKGLLGTLRAALGNNGYTVEEVFVTAEQRD